MNLIPIVLSTLLLVQCAYAEPPADDVPLWEYVKVLMDSRVRTFSKREEHLRESPSAIYVIKADDIKRSGKTSLPELLRDVPGVHVGRITSSIWAVSMRGPSSIFGGKVLVLIDGRDTYLPLFGGTWWDNIDLPLEDIDRIEILRGPQGTLWGGNALEGVINIITKNSADTLGSLLTLGTGNLEKGVAVARHGARVGDASAVRFYLKYNERAPSPDTGGTAGNDDWSVAQMGFRYDIDTSNDQEYFVSGKFYTLSADQKATVNPYGKLPRWEVFDTTTTSKGGSLNFRHVRSPSDQEEVIFSGSYTGFRRDALVLEELRHTLDVEADYHYRGFEQHKVTAGGGARFTRDHVKGDSVHLPDQPIYSSYIIDTYIQDHYTLSQDLSFLLGSHLLFAEEVGFQLQPSLKVVHFISNRYSTWASISRAASFPMRSGLVSTYPPVSPTSPYTTISYGRKGPTETRLAYETGMRLQPSESLYLDSALFWYRVEGRGSLEASDPPVHTIEGREVAPLQFVGNVYGEVYGGEIWMRWQPGFYLTVQPSYSFSESRLTDRSTGLAVPSTLYPRHILRAQTTAHISESLSLTGSFSHLISENTTDYTRLDISCTWQATSSLQMTLSVDNLLDERVVELPAPSAFRPTLSSTSYYALVTLRF